MIHVSEIICCHYAMWDAVVGQANAVTLAASSSSSSGPVPVSDSIAQQVGKSDGNSSAGDSSAGDSSDGNSSDGDNSEQDHHHISLSPTATPPRHRGLDN